MSNNRTYKKLGELATFSRGLTFSKADVADVSSKKVLRSNNIDLNSHSLNYGDVACLNETFVIPDEKKLHKGDIFICMSNGSTQHLGKVAFIEDDIDYAFGGFMGAIHPNVKLVYPKYVFYSCLSTEYRRYLASVLNGVNINNLKWSELSNFPIPIPPLSTQSRIVSELDLLQSIIDKQKTQLKELDNLAQAIFYDMFGDPVENEKGWEVKKFGDECSEMKYGTSRPSCENGKYPYLRMCNISNDGHLDLNNLKTIDVPNDEVEKCIVRYGDILFNRTNSIELIGKTCMFNSETPMIIAGYIIRVRLSEKLESRFISCLFNMPSIKKKLRAMAKGAVNQANINSRELASVIIPIPPLSLQQSFAQKIESIERQKELINQSIREAQTLFDSRMEYYFGE